MQLITEKIEKYIILRNSTVADGIRTLNENGGIVCVIVGSNNVVVGTVTDGDIRRALLKGATLSSNIMDVCCSDFAFVLQGSSRQSSYMLMMERKLDSVLVLNDKKQLVDIFLANKRPDQFKRLSLCAVLMAGGKGKRLFPLTKDVPKPLLFVGDKPILEIILEGLIEQGIRKFWISINYLGHLIKDHFGDGSKWGVEIEYLEETEPLGTAGALGLLPDLEEQNILVMNSDILSTMDISKMLARHEETGASVTVAAKLHEMNVPFGVIDVNSSNVSSITEKPSVEFLINAGAYLIRSPYLKYVMPGEIIDMTTLINRGIENDEAVVPFVLLNNWLDIGRPEQLEMARRDFS